MPTPIFTDGIRTTNASIHGQTPKTHGTSEPQNKKRRARQGPSPLSAAAPGIAVTAYIRQDHRPGARARC